MYLLTKARLEGWGVCACAYMYIPSVVSPLISVMFLPLKSIQYRNVSVCRQNKTWALSPVVQ